MTDGKAAAQLLRQQLKGELGLGPRRVSVRVVAFGWSERIDVRIKAPGIDRSAVEAIAERHESIRRDDYGQMLSGLNVFVHVSVVETATPHLQDRALEALQGMAVGARATVLGREVEALPGGMFEVAGSRGRKLEFAAGYLASTAKGSLRC